jgi:hypothetical protein
MCLRWSVKVWPNRVAAPSGVHSNPVGVGVHIRCCGNGGWRFRPYGDSLFLQAPKKSKQKNACSYVRPTRWGSGFLRSGIHQGGIASGLLRCTSSRCVRLRRTVAALPPPRMNPSTQPSDVARGSRSRAAAELTHILLSGEERAVCPDLLWELACRAAASQRWRPGSRQYLPDVPSPTVEDGLSARCMAVKGDQQCGCGRGF